MLKFGKISDVDAGKGLARVNFDDDDMVSRWLPMLVLKSKSDKYSYCFDVDEHVACMMDEHCEDGVVMGAIYDSKNKPDGGDKDKLRVKFNDGTAVEYDRKNNKLLVEVKGDIEFKADKTVTIDCPDNTIKGKLTVEQDVTMQGKLDVTSDISSNGKVSAATGVESQADVKAGAGVISLLTHKHTSAAPGSPTGPSIP
jgi:phage baseplate assembly protein V